MVQTSVYGGGMVLALNLPRPNAARAAAASNQPTTLTAAEWKTLDAITARIIPTDDDPGAREAGCVNFIDKAVAHEDAEALPLYQLGLAGVEAVAAKRHGVAFASLDPAQQDALLEALEDASDGGPDGWPAGPVPSALFFETARAHTVIGFLADPKYGGNRDFAGWKLVGYPGPRHKIGGYSPKQMLGEEPIRAVWGEDL